MLDLHCHTNVSDNSMTIGEIVQIAKRMGITHLAVTDHDTTLGIPEAVAEGVQAGIEIIPGIEISAYDFKRKKRAHILGLFIIPEHSSLKSLCDPLLIRRQEASWEMVNRLNKAGYGITWEKVTEYARGGTGVYKQHIMHALLDEGYCNTIYGDLYKKLFSRGSNGSEPGVAFLEIEYIDAIEAIHAVRDAGGIAILAHPGQLGNFESIPELVYNGLQGLEAYHPSHSETDERHCEILAEEYGLYLTGGSDFHGLYNERKTTPGCKKLNRENIQAMKERRVR